MNNEIAILGYQQDEYASREEWLAGRQGTIGASSAPTIMGCNQWETQLKLYARLTGAIPAKEQTEEMKMGNRLEPIISDLYREETGRKIGDPGDFAIQRNPDCPWMHCTVDRFVIMGPHLGDCGDGVLEEKAPGHHMGSEWEAGIPLPVQVQIQHQLAVTGLQWGSAAALIGGQKFVWGDVQRNQPFIDELLVKTKEFADRVAAEDPPLATGADVETLRLLYPEHTKAKSIDLPDAGVAHDSMLQQLKKEIKTAEEAKSWHEAKIMEMIGDAEYGRLPDLAGGYSWKSADRKSYTVKATKTRTLRRHK